MNEKYDVIVIGAGAAGMMSAIEAGKRGRKVLLIDHATKIGEKIITVNKIGTGDISVTDLTALNPSLVDISAVEALTDVTDLVKIGDASSITTASSSVIFDHGTDATNMDNGATASVGLINNGTVVASTLEPYIEAGGTGAITFNNALAVGDAFLVVSDDNINSALFLVIVGGNGIADNETAASTELTAVKLLTYAGLTTAQNFHADALDFIV